MPSDAPPPRGSRGGRSSRNAAPSRSGGVWGAVVDHTKQAKKVAAETGKGDSNVIVMGSKGAGKSSVVLKFLGSERAGGESKPTMGLDYCFARRAGGADMEKKVSHIWELGGGEDQADLIDAVVTPENLRNNFVAVIVVDLSKPGSVLATVTFWIERLRARVEHCLRVMAEKRSTLPERLRERSRVAFGAAHEDAELVSLSPIPIVLCAAQWDTFEAQDAEYRKIMSRTLRFVAHVNGASLAFTSSHDNKGMRALLGHELFGAPRPEKAVVGGS